MSPEQVERLFIAFEQVGRERAKTHEGTGLGLVISQMIVQLMGSAIRVRSEVGAGSVFTFDLELPEALNWAEENASRPRERIVGLRGARKRILVVDDVPENRSVIVDFLAPLGFEVVEAVDGQEGVEKALEHKPDLIITDLAMPRLSGIEMMQEIRKIPELSSVPIIVSSASAFETDRQKSLKAGGNDFIAKPVSVEALVKGLERHLGVEWIYEQREPTAETEALAVESDGGAISALSAEALAELLELANKGRLNSIQEQLQRLERSDARWSAIAKELGALIAEFDVRGVRARLKELVDKGERPAPLNQGSQEP
jgi:CheY-like chemotaxis protein